MLLYQYVIKKMNCVHCALLLPTAPQAKLKGVGNFYYLFYLILCNYFCVNQIITLSIQFKYNNY